MLAASISETFSSFRFRKCKPAARIAVVRNIAETRTAIVLIRLSWLETRWINSADSDAIGMRLVGLGDMDINCEAVALESPLKNEVVIDVGVFISVVLVNVWFDITELANGGLIIPAILLESCDDAAGSGLMVPDIEDVAGALTIMVDICVMVDNETTRDVKIEVWI